MGTGDLYATVDTYPIQNLFVKENLYAAVDTYPKQNLLVIGDLYATVDTYPTQNLFVKEDLYAAVDTYPTQNLFVKEDLYAAVEPIFGWLLHERSSCRIILIPSTVQKIWIMSICIIIYYIFKR